MATWHSCNCSTETLNLTERHILESSGSVQYWHVQGFPPPTLGLDLVASDQRKVRLGGLCGKRAFSHTTNRKSGIDTDVAETFMTVAVWGCLYGALDLWDYGAFGTILELNHINNCLSALHISKTSALLPNIQILTRLHLARPQNPLWQRYPIPISTFVWPKFDLCLIVAMGNGKAIEG